MWVPFQSSEIRSNDIPFRPPPINCIAAIPVAEEPEVPPPPADSTGEGRCARALYDYQAGMCYMINYKQCCYIYVCIYKQVMQIGELIR